MIITPFWRIKIKWDIRALLENQLSESCSLDKKNISGLLVLVLFISIVKISMICYFITFEVNSAYVAPWIQGSYGVSQESTKKDENKLRLVGTNKRRENNRRDMQHGDLG